MLMIDSSQVTSPGKIPCFLEMRKEHVDEMLTVVCEQVVLLPDLRLILDPLVQHLRAQSLQSAHKIRRGVFACPLIIWANEKNTLVTNNAILEELKREGVEAKLDDEPPVFDPSHEIAVAFAGEPLEVAEAFIYYGDLSIHLVVSGVVDHVLNAFRHGSSEETCLIHLLFLLLLYIIHGVLLHLFICERVMLVFTSERVGDNRTPQR